MVDRARSMTNATEDDPLSIVIIRCEHDSILKTLDAIAAAMKPAAGEHQSIDLGAVRALFAYLDSFPEQVHHPKEDRHLFARLERACATTASVLQPLRSEHKSSDTEIDNLQRRLRWISGSNDHEFQKLAREMARFDQSYRRHIRIEEDVVFPLAMHYLSVADWAEIDQAFAGNVDPVGRGQSIEAFQERMKDALAGIDALIKPIPEP